MKNKKLPCLDSDGKLIECPNCEDILMIDIDKMIIYCECGYKKKIKEDKIENKWD